MNDCLKSISSNIDISGLLSKLEELVTYIETDPIEVDKVVAKTVLSAFINCWKFASNDQSDLLELYFTVLSSAKAFDQVAKPFLKLISTNTGFRPVKWVYRLFRMCCILFSEEIPELSQEVLRIKVQLLEEIAEQSSRLCSISIHFMLNKSKSTADDADQVLLKAMQVCYSNKEKFILVSCYLRNSLQNAELRTSSLETIVKNYLSILSAARKTPERSVILAGGMLAAACNHDILSKDLFPALSRGVKRNAEMATPCMMAAVQSLKVDSSRYLTYLIDTCMYFFKQDNVEATGKVGTFLRAAVSHCSDNEALLGLVNSIFKEMESMRPSLTVKRQVYIGVSEIVKAVEPRVMQRSDIRAFARSMIPVLLAVYKKEVNNINKCHVMDILGSAVCLGEEVNADVQALVKSGLNLSGAACMPTLYLLDCITSVPGASVDGKAVLPMLEQAIERALAKPFLNGREGILALPTIIRVAVMEGIAIPAVVGKASEFNSYLFMRSLFSTTNADEKCVVSWCQRSVISLLEQVMKTQALNPREECHVSQLLFDLIATDHSEMQAQGLEMLRSLCRDNERLHGLLESFQCWLMRCSALPFYNDDYPLRREPAVAMLKAMASGSVENSDVVLFAWCTSHPFLNIGHNPSVSWNTILKVLMQKLKEIKCDEDMITSVKTLLDDEELDLQNSDPYVAKTTEQMLIHLMSIPSLAEPMYVALRGDIIQMVQSTAVNDVTLKDLSIWQTPDNVEWKPRQEDSGYVPEVSQSRKPKAKKSGNSSRKSDEQWAKELKAELNKDKIAKEEAEKAIAARMEALKQQAEVRAEVDAIAKPYREALIRMRCMAVGAKSNLVNYFSEMVQLISNLLSNPLVYFLARETFMDCSKALQDTKLEARLNNCLYVTFFMPLYSIEKLIPCATTLFEDLIPLLDEGFLSSCYLPLFLPILKVLTFAPEASATYKSVVSVLQHFIDVADDNQESTLRSCRVDVCEILLELLRVAPRLDPSPENVLMAYCDASPSLQPREVLLLLGDRGILSSSEDVRMNALINLEHVDNFASNPLYIMRLFMAQYDDDEDIAEEAKQEWEEKQLTLPPSFHLPLFQLLGHSVDKIRRAAARAITHGLFLYPQAAETVLDRVEKKCEEIQSMEDPNERKGQQNFTMALFFLLEQCATEKAFAVEQVDRVMDLLFVYGFCHEVDEIRMQAMKAGECLMESYGSECPEEILSYLNTKLSSLEKDADTDEECAIQDHQREGGIVLLGKVTCYLEDGDKRIFSTIDTLLNSLSIPAASVQEAIARYLTPLFKYDCLKAQAKTYIDALLNQLTAGSSYATRRGAAVGLAGVIKGLGSKALRDYDIISFIESAAQSTSMTSREGAMMVLAALFDSLTFMFEPYVVKFLPILLENFSSKDEGVREAAQLASRSVMRNLSPHGVKLVMPKVLEGLDDSRWRTKQVAIRMLGSMAYCSPQSLSACLPRIVPILTESCNDAHLEIQQSAQHALMDIGNVIRTPEIADLQQVLLKALTEPHIHTADALKTLTETSFHHTIDAPSLSLIVPILMRGLNERVTDTKKKAALIVGNICSLANRTDVLPYLGKLLVPLKKCLVDPLPDVRAVAAHSIGLLGHEVGEEEMKDMLEWLIEKVYEDSTVAERSGAAQGLADLMGSLSEEHFQEILKELLLNATHPRACVREGVMWTISFLPSTLGNRFASLVSVILPAIVSGLADESEMVAEVALRAGRVIVQNYSKSNLNQVLPPIKTAMMDDDWRIRQSSVMLVGELLYTLGKTRAVGMSETENDTGLSSTDVEELLQKELGMQTWIEVMASLFYLTTDVTATVRQSAFQVWKSVVNNTPRTLKKILGELTQLCFTMFTSDSENKRTLAARCLGEIVQKLGEFVIPHVLKVLNNGLQSDDPVTRQVVCMGFVQVLTNCSSATLKVWGDEFLQSLKVSICDEDEAVRTAAANALSLLQKKGNGTAFNSILPILLEDLESTDKDRQHRAMNGLRQIIVLQGRQIIATLFMKLTARPLTVSHLYVMRCIMPSTAKYLHFFFSDYVNEFMQDLFGKNDEAETPMNDREIADAISETLRDMVINIQTSGVQWAITCLDKISNYVNNGYRRESCLMLASFIEGTASDFKEQIQMILRLIIKRAADPDPTVIAAAWKALTALFAKVKVEEMLPYVSFISNMIATVISTERYKPGVDMNTYVLPAFEAKEGLKPLFQMLQKGIMVASAERKGDCASLICDLVQYAPTQNIRLYALQITGPLIRIIGDKYTPEIRVLLFRALNLLLSKSGDALRPFLPQLQTTFIRALKDSTKGVRTEGGEALVHIIKLSTRIDNVINDLSDDVAKNDTEVRESVMTTLKNIMLVVGDRVQATTCLNLESKMLVLMVDPQEDVRVLAAGVLGVVMKYAPDERFQKTMRNILTDPAFASTEESHGRCMALGQILKYNNERCKPLHEEIIHKVHQFLKNDSLMIRKSAISVCKYVLNVYNTMEESNKKLVLDEMISDLTSCIYDGNSSIRYETVISISLFAKVCKGTDVDLLGVLVPTLQRSVQDSYVPVKLASERALLHLLQIHENPEVLENYLRTCDPAAAKYLKTYVQKVLIKLPKTADDDIGQF